MPLRFFLLLTFFLPAAAQAALVMGSMRNSSAGEAVQVLVPQAYLDGKTNRFAGSIDANGKFSIAVRINEPQLVFLEYNDSRLAMFLTDKDTLSLNSDKFQFPLVATFSGKAGANNAVLFQYFRENPVDYNEFNNIRFKVGQWWFGVEQAMSEQMEQLDPASFVELMDKHKLAGLALIDDFNNQNPGALSPVFMDFLSTEILYYWAYHMTFYGQVYGNRHQLDASFFEFLYEAPMVASRIGSEWYRQFLLLYMARYQAVKDQNGPYWSGQYYHAAEFLSDKSLAFFRSEIISMAFSRERFQEILPLYRDFLQKNTWVSYDTKIEDLYQKISRTSAGTRATDFTATQHNGQTLSLNAYKGKVVYLNFWASWCGACLRKMEFFDEFEAELKAAGVEIVNVSIDEDATKWDSALLEHPFKGAQLLASSAKGLNLATAYNVEAIPQYFIINRNGTFAEKPLNNQPNDIRDQLLKVAKGN